MYIRAYIYLFTYIYKSPRAMALFRQTRPRFHHVYNTYIHVNIYMIYIHMYTLVYIYMYIFTYIYKSPRAMELFRQTRPRFHHVHIYIHTCTHIYNIYTYVYTCVYIYIHIFTYIYKSPRAIELFRQKSLRFHQKCPIFYGVATIGRLLKIIGFFCRISSLL